MKVSVYFTSILLVCCGQLGISSAVPAGDDLIRFEDSDMITDDKPHYLPVSPDKVPPDCHWVGTAPLCYFHHCPKGEVLHHKDGDGWPAPSSGTGPLKALHVCSHAGPKSMPSVQSLLKVTMSALEAMFDFSGDLHLAFSEEQWWWKGIWRVSN
ncbi:MAG: hypothetical protein Q9222_007772 [Ikaeria aurantiellina]